MEGIRKMQRDYAKEERLYECNWLQDDIGWYMIGFEGEYHTFEEAVAYNKTFDKE